MMIASRYKESRILVRPVCRLPGEDKAAYRDKVRRLRRHFEQFNIDVSDLCQWLMGLRKSAQDIDPALPAASFGLLGDFLLEPTLEEADDSADWRAAHQQ